MIDITDHLTFGLRNLSVDFIQCGSYHSVALISDSSDNDETSVYTFGAHLSLGVPSIIENTHIPQKVDLKTDNHIEQIYASYGRTAAMDSKLPS